MAKPPDIKSGSGGQRFKRGDDVARVLLRPGQFRRPTLAIPGGQEFEWPGGTESWSLTGSAALGIHKYINGNAPVVQVVHRDESRIILAGQFPGLTGAQNARELYDLLVHEGPPQGKLLDLPGVFRKKLRVHAENWNFSKADEDHQSVNYEITFVKVGVFGDSDDDSKLVVPPGNPTSTGKGGSARTIRVKEGMRTLRAVASNVYRDPAKWRQVYDLNRAKLNKLYPGTSQSEFQTKMLQLGLELAY